MGKAVCCQECGKVHRNLEDLEDLRDNDSICLVCNTPIEVSDWDRVLASYEEDEEDLDDIDADEEADWGDEKKEDDDDDAVDDGFEEFDDDLDSAIEDGDEDGDEEDEEKNV